MMRAILGSALGGVVAGAVALVASAQSRAPEALTPNAPTASPYAMTVADINGTPVVGAAAPTSVVQCEPGQEAVLQRSLVADREIAQVTCMTRAIAPLPLDAAPVAPEYRQVADAPPDIVERPMVRTVQPRARRVVDQREEVKPKRSWKKSALIIGGSAGAGAGIGAMAGGKKGALIGAAIGGGSGAVYEAIKRK